MRCQTVALLAAFLLGASAFSLRPATSRGLQPPRRRSLNLAPRPSPLRHVLAGPLRARGDRGTGRAAAKDEVDEFSLAKCLVLVNIVFYAMQVASAYVAHDQITALLTKMKMAAPGSLDRGLPFSLPHYTLGRGGFSLHAQGTFTRDFLLMPNLVDTAGQWYRAVSSAFLHGSVLHLFFNMQGLNRVGPQIERKFGKRLFAAAFGVSVFAGAFAHMAASPYRAALGASGGLMGLYGFLWAYHHRRGEASQAKALLQHMFWVLLYGFMVPNIGNAAHVGGFLGGAAMSFLVAEGTGGPSNNQRGGSVNSERGGRGRDDGLHYKETRSSTALRRWGRDINTGAERVEPKLKVPLWGGEVPLWAGLGFLLLVSHPLRLALWQLPCALNLHAMSPGLLARGVSPAASVADPALRSFLLSIP